MIQKIYRYLQGKRRHRQSEQAKAALLSEEGNPDTTTPAFPASLEDPTSFYERTFIGFHRSLPDGLRNHREYFKQEKRGFGEDAFHVMWWRLFNEFKPTSFLEIGVYRGQVLSLVSLIAKHEGVPCRVVGISPFSCVGDTVSKYRTDLDYRSDTLSNFAHFSLTEPELLKAYSTDPEAVKVIKSTEWDMIYIDGNHDYEIVLKDWQVCAASLKPGGIIILDDSGLSTSYQPPPFATGGHPGPSRLASEIDSYLFREILQVGHNRVFQKSAQ